MSLLDDSFVEDVPAQLLDAAPARDATPVVAASFAPLVVLAEPTPAPPSIAPALAEPAPAPSSNAPALAEPAPALAGPASALAEPAPAPAAAPSSTAPAPALVASAPDPSPSLFGTTTAVAIPRANQAQAQAPPPPRSTSTHSVGSPRTGEAVPIGSLPDVARVAGSASQASPPLSAILDGSPGGGSNSYRARSISATSSMMASLYVP